MFRYIIVLLVCILGFIPACQIVSKDMGRTTQALPNQAGLSRYVGLDLRKLKRSERKDLQRTFEKLTGVKRKFGSRGLRPWWVSKYRNGKTGWILFEGYEGVNIPDISHVRINRFDGNWEYLGSDAFPTGYRLYIDEAKVVREPVLNIDVIEIRTVGGLNLRQVYVILVHSVALVRLEDDKQNIVQLSYSWKMPTIGPAVPKRTVEQWQQSLDSRNPCEVLETLVWLSGRHLPSDAERKPNTSQESVEDSRLFEAVSGSPEVKQKILSFRESPNIWIRQAAELVIAHGLAELPGD